MELLVVVILLLALSRSSSSSSDSLPHSSGEGDRGDAGDGSDHDPLGDLVDAGKGLLPLLAGGGSGAGAIGAGSGTAGAITPAGATGGAGAPVVAGVSGSALVGQVTVGLLANPIAWVVYILIASKVVEAQERDKDFQSELLHLNVSARALHDFERAATREILLQRGLAEYTGPSGGRGAGGVFRAVEQRDDRLRKFLLGSKLEFQGWRTTYKFPWQPGDEVVFRQLRSLGLEYLRLRAGHGYRMIRYLKPEVRVPGDVIDPRTLQPTGSWGFAYRPFDTWHEMYEDPTMPGNMPGLGGLLDVPLAADGVTQSPRLDNNEYPNDPAQLRPPPYEAEPINDVTTADLQSVRLAALLDALFVLRWDARPLIDLDASNYAEDTLKALSEPVYGEADAAGVRSIVGYRPPEGISRNGQLLVLDSTLFGEVVDARGEKHAIAVDPQAIRQTFFGNKRPKVVAL